MGPPMGFDLINTSILDANLLTNGTAREGA
jgi:hypothetical protein